MIEKTREWDGRGRRGELSSPRYSRRASPQTDFRSWKSKFSSSILIRFDKIHFELTSRWEKKKIEREKDRRARVDFRSSTVLVGKLKGFPILRDAADEDCSSLARSINLWHLAEITFSELRRRKTFSKLFGTRVKSASQELTTSGAFSLLVYPQDTKVEWLAERQIIEWTEERVRPR